MHRKVANVLVQPLMLLCCNNLTVAGISKNAVQNRDHNLWRCVIFWLPIKSTENSLIEVVTRCKKLGDCCTIHHAAACHRKVQPFYVHNKSSPLALIWALPKPLQWCVGNILASYVHSSILLDVLHGQNPGMYDGQTFHPFNHQWIGAYQLILHCMPLDVALTCN